MPDMAVMVIDPGGYRFAQLVDDRWQVRHLVPILVERLGLPRDLTYELIPTATSNSLHADATLVGADVRPGAELLLQPVRNGLFLKLREKLYEEARDFVVDKIWDLAKKRLTALFRLDPAYPDRDNLRETLRRAGFAVGDGLPRSGPSSSPPPLPDGAGLPAADIPTSGKTTAGNASGSSAFGCFVVVVLLAGAALAYYKPWQNWRPGQQANQQRPGEPKLGTGDVQITLRWRTAADLDLRVTDPQGQQVWFGNRTIPSGGHLDVDANDSCKNNIMANPVENVYWPNGRAPRGDYHVAVQYTFVCNQSGPTDYEVTVRVNGQVQRTERGTLRPSETNNVVTFRY